MSWAGRIEVARGSIRNVALADARLATADGGAVTMAYVLHATCREYQKWARSSAGEFGDLTAYE